MMEKIKTLCFVVLLTLCSTVNAQEWIDVTDVFITNPDFKNNNNDDWSWTSNASSQTCRAECMEFWNGTFNFWQGLTGLPQGKYRLSVQAFYRVGSNDYAYSAYREGTEDLTAIMYADSHEQPLLSVYSYEFPEAVNGCWTYNSGGWWGGGETHHFPNSMESASVAFGNGAYWNQFEFDAEGDIVIGLKNENYRNDNWCIFTNFKLEFSGNAVKAQSVTVNADHTDLLVGETLQLTATVLPANTLQKKVKWTSGNAAVATVDENGLVTAVEKGQATITATTTDGSNKRATVTLTVSRNEATSGSLVINEIMASNVDEFISPAFNFDGWIELYNTTGRTVGLTGLILSDGDGNRWTLPTELGVIESHSYKCIWFDSNNIAPENAPFKLDTDGGTITLSNGSGEVIDTQTYPASMERISYARTSDNGSTWGFTQSATPGASNNGRKFAEQQLAAPVVDQPSQLFTGQLSVNVTVPSGCTLRYTTDGSLPTLTNGKTGPGQFRVDGTTCYRFRLFANGMLASPVTTRSYIYKNRDYYLPVISVVSDQDFLYSSEIGVFQKGPNGRPGNGQADKCNWNMDWERPVNFSYITADGDMALNQDVNLEMCGGWSRAWSPRAFKLKGNKEMGGNKNLPYPFFTQKPYIRNRTLQIRNGGNDNGCRFKDPALGYMIWDSGVDIDVQSYQPVHEFINGQYIGVLNMREPNNKHYVYANYGWDEDEIDQFEMSPDSGYVQKCGTPDNFEELVNLSESAANSETYSEICQMLDIDAYANYMAAELYLGGTDWPQNNVKGFRHVDGGKWRFVFFDVDFAFNTSDAFNLFMNKNTYSFDELYPRGTGHITEEIRFVTLFRNLLQNSDFRRRFIDAYSLMGGSVFEASRAQQICDELYNNVQPAMQLNGESAYNSYNDWKNKLGSRLNTATNMLKNYSRFGLSSANAQRVKLSSNAEGAQLLVNGQQVPTGRFDGNMFQPVTLKAVAPAGYAFQGWLSNSGSVGTTLKAKGTSWYYYDQGSLDGKNWTSPSYNTSGWKQGKAPLGYSNKETMNTLLDYGSDSNNKRPTYYFRTTVNLENAPVNGDMFSLDYYVDDGLIIYVNGSEAGRFNMPSGNVNYNTFSTTYGDQFPTGTLDLPASLFHKGSNVIAVEVHNNEGKSTDIIWDAAILAQFVNTSSDYYSTDAEISLPDGSNLQFIANYRQLTDAERAQQGISPVRVNEVSGANSCFINEYGKKDDWVELYNTTDHEIDVEGMFLSDDEATPEKYQITKGSTRANTKIPAHGYLLVWCDKRETTNSALHASFKVSADGGVIVLTAADRSWKDKLAYDAHDGNSTVGRYPDGTGEVYVMNVPTIERSNMLSSYVVSVAQDDLTGIHRNMIASANGFRLRYGAQQLLVKSEDDGPVTVELFTTDGRMIERQNILVAGSTGRLNVSHLPQGFYVARAINDEGTRVGCKFMK